MSLTSEKRQIAQASQRARITRDAAKASVVVSRAKILSSALPLAVFMSRLSIPRSGQERRRCVRVKSDDQWFIREVNRDAYARLVQIRGNHPPSTTFASLKSTHDIHRNLQLVATDSKVYYTLDGCAASRCTTVRREIERAVWSLVVMNGGYGIDLRADHRWEYACISRRRLPESLERDQTGREADRPRIRSREESRERWGFL